MDTCIPVSESSPVHSLMDDASSTVVPRTVLNSGPETRRSQQVRGWLSSKRIACHVRSIHVRVESTKEKRGRNGCVKFGLMR